MYDFFQIILQYYGIEAKESEEKIDKGQKIGYTYVSEQLGWQRYPVLAIRYS